MMEQGIEALVELGPGRVLNGFMKRIDRKFPVFNVSETENLEKTAEALIG
jgi:[acyl-carrier-protein] S-malonyltransferase